MDTPNDPMAAIRAVFFEECAEQLAELETGLTAMSAGARDAETVNAVFRAVHSVKGGAGAFGLDDLVRFAHVFETALDDVRAGRVEAGPALLKAMLHAADVLSDLVSAARDGTVADPHRAKQAAEALSAAIAEPAGAAEVVAEVAQETSVPVAAAAAVAAEEDPFGFTPVVISLDLPDSADAAPAEPEAGVWTIAFRPRGPLYAKGNDAALLLRELRRHGSAVVTLDASALPALDAMDADEAYLAWTVRLTTNQPEAVLREVFDFVEDDCAIEIGSEGGLPLAAPVADPVPASVAAHDLPLEVTPVAVPAGPPATQAAVPAPRPAPEPPAAAAHAEPGATTIRVDLDRVDRLINLVGELVINSAMLTQRAVESGLSRSAGVMHGLEELEQLTRGIQDSVMAIRAQPVKSVFQRMPRLVREVAGMTGKQVRLATDGEGTEVDKTIIERLSDPLTHMIRNAIDHGLETPDKRRAAGKPEEGVVRLSALHRSGRIVIEVADDGAGINRERVRAIAVEKGLIAADAPLTDEEIDNLIFLPGFSTAAAVSDISGRGVGMDVVKRSIQSLGGRIAIASQPGRGSAFTLSLPLTLAVLDGMVVTVAGQTLVAPLSAIVETLQPKRNLVHGLGEEAELVSVRGAYVPLIDIGRVLGFRQDRLPSADGVALLAESESGQRAALLVDAIQGQRQVVIKSLEANYQAVQIGRAHV